MEIERKWMVKGWPSVSYPLVKEEDMEQGYLTVRPTVRIRRESQSGGDTEYVLCIKKGTGIAREEIEIAIEKEKYEDLRRVIGLPMIGKVRRSYRLPDNLVLEVNHVDEGQPTEFWYAEIEYPDISAGKDWVPEDPYLREYLSDDVTYDPEQSMGAYWLKTRGQVYEVSDSESK